MDSCFKRRKNSFGHYVS